MDNIEEKIKNLKEWNEERAKVKPFIDTAVDYHNKARTEAYWKNYDSAANLYKEAIKNYQNAITQQPHYYLKDLMDRIDNVIEEYMNNLFNLKTVGNKLKDEAGIREFVDFIDNLEYEERKYIDSYDTAQAYLRIADFYCEKEDFDTALEFYKRIIEVQCNRPFINRDANFKIGRILFEELRFKEAVISFVSVLSFDRGDKEVIRYLEDCLKRLGISEYKDRFITASPNEAKKLIMEVL